MVCLGFEPGVAGRKVQTNPLSYSCTPYSLVFTQTQTVDKYMFSLCTNRDSDLGMIHA